MRCDQALQMMGELVDGDITGRHQLWLRLHLLICRHCRRYLQSYRATVKAEKNAFVSSDSLVGRDEISDEQVGAILKMLARIGPRDEPTKRG